MDGAAGSEKTTGLRLADLTTGGEATVLGLELAEADAQWLRAVGVHEGAGVRALRRAPFGGPMHLRLSSGLELAMDRELARQVRVELVAR